jgi:hypothetical protein
MGKVFACIQKTKWNKCFTAERRVFAVQFIFFLAWGRTLLYYARVEITKTAVSSVHTQKQKDTVLSSNVAFLWSNIFFLPARVHLLLYYARVEMTKTAILSAHTQKQKE